MLSSRIRARQLQCFRREMINALGGFAGLSLGDVKDQKITEFLVALASSPVKQQSGGGGMNAALILWFLARVIQPSLIVESGVLRGFTSWVLRQAAPQAEIHSFDISFAELAKRTLGVHYHETDWMAASISAPALEPSLAFFDDHVDQWKRIREAAGRGFQYLIFDDNLPANALHGDGIAASPTVDMLFDDNLADGELIEWQTECGRFSLRYDRSLALSTRRVVRRFARLPSLHLCTGFLPANLTLVEIDR